VTRISNYFKDNQVYMIDKKSLENHFNLILNKDNLISDPKELEIANI
jgi:hypothetical protein